MKQRNPETNAVALLAAVVLVCLSLYIARGATIISGKDNTSTAVETRASHGDGTSTTTTTSKTTAPHESTQSRP